ncbi:O-methyltransferase [Mycobacterium sp. M1]|uniref:O-methyltransferase n=1 Tax=Mycolicibacter acidiphilus TaxID=2835306 RepID=A0ABS5RG42_9MYCO|nr:O-methyltransferase [Mycolicibacter acidiphilus]MBS9533250.1 O-methyltransferase [Mycolicibacter acidiphilus]
MTAETTPAAVDDFLDHAIGGDDPDTAAALTASADAGLPAIAVSAQQGRFLNLLATAVGAKRILEIGTLGGYSTIWLARAVGADGSVVTCEYDPKHAAVAQANLDQAGVGARVRVLVGPALKSLPLLTGSAPFDLVFIDADKENNAAYVEWALQLTRPGSVIVVDNVIRDGKILEPHDDGTRGTRRSLELLGEHPKLEAAAIQTVGVKGWDGFALALVK